jgi:hypothetical protein
MGVCAMGVTDTQSAERIPIYHLCGDVDGHTVPVCEPVCVAVSDVASCRALGGESRLPIPYSLLKAILSPPE